MPDNQPSKLLFVINPISGGKEKINWKKGIEDYFEETSHHFEMYTLTGKDDKTALKNHISKYQPDKVIAVGGDGTVKLVAEQLLNSPIRLGILPAGSANGMAKELKIPSALKDALNVINNGIVTKISVVRINEKDISIHLSDIGLNALLVKYFDQSDRRGMLGYAKVVLRVFKTKRLMRIELKLNGQSLNRAAYMVVIANTKSYGTGAVINPDGDLHDGNFELVIVRRLSLLELFRMLISHKPFNPENIEVLQTTQAIITLHKKNHFQVDGEYRGKTDNIKAEIMPAALSVLLPSEN